MAKVASIHPSHEQLAAFSSGALSPAEQAVVEQHVAHCDQCCETLKAVPADTLIERLRTANTSVDETLLTDVQPRVAVPGGGSLPKDLAEHPRYRIVKQLGAGGMGVVYQAVHRMMDRHVALKVISRKLTSKPQAVERFRLEVKAAAKLNHPNIVAAHDAEQAGDLHFLVMEYIEGISLDRFVEKRGPLPVLNACNYVMQAARGLQHAHELKMVHRDIKPANLMLTRKGQIKVLDFGLARLAAHDPGETTMSGRDAGGKSAGGLTLAGTILGTPDYIAPEQAEESRAVDIRADIYSLGCTLYFLLTGQPPYPQGSITEKLESHIVSRPRPVGELRQSLPDDVVQILDKMLARDPADRFQTPAEVVQAMAPWSKSQPPKDEWDFAALEREAATPTIAYLPPRTGSSKSTRPASGNAVADALGPFVAPLRNLIRRHRRSVKAAAVIGLAGLALWLGSSLVPWGDLKSSVVSLVPKSSAIGGSGDADRGLGDRGQSGGSARTASGRVASSQAGEPGDSWRSVLLVVPNKMVWMGDYKPVRTALESGGYSVTVASSLRTSARPDDDSRKNGVPDVPVDLTVSEARATDYAMIVFIGGDVSEFVPGGAAVEPIQRLVSDFAAEKKFVGSICAGNVVLAATSSMHGRRVADNQYFEMYKVRAKVRDKVKLISNSFVLDEPFLSAKDFSNAAEFADKLVWALDRRGKK
ncbi:MAG: protein kinase [Planctomycetales bacterium]|nr:protein kinase [Planctomycetales bacterium]